MELKPLFLLSVQFLESSQFTALNISGTSGMDHVWQRRGRRFSAHQTFSIIESRESNSLSLPRGEEETCYLPSVLRDRPHTGRGASSRGVPPPVPPRSPRSKAPPPHHPPPQPCGGVTGCPRTLCPCEIFLGPLVFNLIDLDT